MSEKKYYLRPDVAMEPLVNQWYAHPYLLAPATAAMTIASSHTSILKSYVRAPKMHADALKNPAMRGGPFIDYEGGRVGEIEELLKKTTSEQGHMFKFAESVKELDRMLETEAKGYSLEPFYEKVPDVLKGYVELVYDRNNYPGARFIEGLLYHSPYFNRASQGLSFFLQEKDRRPFILSTPRLSDDRHIHVSVPFDSERVDALFRLQDTPQPFEHIRELLGGNGNAEAFRQFLTEEAPAPARGYDGDGMRIRYFGHACLVLQTRHVTIMTDPLLSPALPGGKPRYTMADLPEVIDYVLITHNHQDHVMLETLLPLRSRIKRIIVPRNGAGSLEDPSIKLMLQHVGFKDVYEIDEMERIELPGGSITAVPFFGEHGDLNIRTKSAYCVDLEGRKALCVADSSILEPRVYKCVHDAIGDADALFLSMECVGAPVNWAYGAVFTKAIDRKMADSRRTKGSNFLQGIGMVEQFNCKQAYVYAIGHEPWMFHILAVDYEDDDEQILESTQFVEECRRRGVVSERLYCQKEIVL